MDRKNTAEESKQAERKEAENNVSEHCGYSAHLASYTLNESTWAEYPWADQTMDTESIVKIKTAWFTRRTKIN